MNERVFKNIVRNRETDKQRFDLKKRTRKERLAVGTLVLIFDSTIGKQRQLKLSDKWFGPYKIIKDNLNGSYILSELDGVRIKGTFAGNRLKEFHVALKDVGLSSTGEDVVDKYHDKERYVNL
ncbi:hypothetical protein AYI69_g168 [Smittium culicis]|uniref:Uncharacterized protein n=1 Tax=Smittium culicis TaxID=133412 RepID=A0A1R1YTX4_9FUNG|nr:hypothetical protein AYI69_g168 [Smittium culicis]